MIRSPPRKVYCNKRLKKTGAVISSTKMTISRQPLFRHNNATSSFVKSHSQSSHNLDGNIFSSVNESQLKNISQHPSTSSAQDEKKREHFNTKKLFVDNFKTQSREIILGIPQQHTYVNRKKQSTLMASIDKETENYDRTSSNLRYATECHEQILTEPVDNNDPFGEMEFAQEVCATLNSTFEEILNDCPEFKTATIERDNVLKKLKSYSLRQPVIQNTTITNNIDESPASISYYNVPRNPNSFVEFSHSQEVHVTETMPKDNDCFATPIPSQTASKLISAVNLPETISHRVKRRFNTREFLPRLRPTLLSNSPSSSARPDEHSARDSFSYGGT